MKADDVESSTSNDVNASYIIRVNFQGGRWSSSSNEGELIYLALVF
uniref:Uncharacterized protein n=1 Tax=Manihot esculenta TaxID=3983 RepID=A0A2C9VEI1_MANES